MSFGALLRRYRLAAGLTQETLAERAGLSVRGISDLERGVNRAARPLTVALLAEALSLDPEARATLHAAAAPSDDAGVAAGSAGATPRARVPTNLPLSLSSFVGRDQELGALQHRLGQTRLLTLTGAGGIGKTRLALELARRVSEGVHPAVSPRDGVWLVELAALGDGALVPAAVARVLGLREQPGQALLTALTEVLRPQAVLLVLDNCEHLLDACAHLVEAVLRTCPHVRVLATSREALRIDGEQPWRVPSLPLPEPWGRRTPERALTCAAVQLFVQRAQVVRPQWTLSAAQVPLVEGLCRRLEGIPLALELAAARLATLPLDEAVARLDDHLRLLSGGSRMALPRQQTLRATLDWSYDLLSQGERRLFARLAVFAGGWTLAAAEVICADESLAAEEVLDLLGGLVAKSLVQLEEGVTGTPRYAMLETIRAYASERLRAQGVEHTIRAAHATYMLERAEEAEHAYYGPRSTAAFTLLEVEHDNLRAALGWSLSGGEPQVAVRLAGALYRFWEVRGHLAEGQRWLEAILAREVELGPDATVLPAHEPGQAFPAASGARSPWGRVLTGAGALAWRQGQASRATRWNEQRLTLSRALGDAVGIACALNDLGATAASTGDYAGAAAYFRHSLELDGALGHPVARAVIMSNLGGALRRLGETERAEVLLEEALVLLQQEEDNADLPDVLCELAALAASRGDVGRATALYQQCGAHVRRAGNILFVPAWVEGVAALAGQEGQAERAARLWGAAAGLREKLAVPLSVAERAAVDAALPRSRAALEEAAWERAWAAGWGMSVEDMLTYILDGSEA